MTAYPATAAHSASAVVLIVRWAHRNDASAGTFTPLAGLRAIPARHAPWLACPVALSVNSTPPTFLSPPQVGRVEFMDSATGTHANYHPGVDLTLTVDSRLTAVPHKPSNRLAGCSAPHPSTSPVG